jgi:hypothetical protein
MQKAQQLNVAVNIKQMCELPNKEQLDYSDLQTGEHHPGGQNIIGGAMAYL